MRPLVNSLLQDKRESEAQIQSVTVKLVSMRISNPTPEDKTQLINQIIRVVSLELHNLFKYKQTLEYIFKLAQFEEQALLMREMLDYSPISFVDTLIPWVVKQMQTTKQVSSNSQIIQKKKMNFY